MVILADYSSGTGGFLVASMHHMLEQTDSNNRTVRDNIKKIQIHGIGIKNYKLVEIAEDDLEEKEKN